MWMTGAVCGSYWTFRWCQFSVSLISPQSQAHGSRFRKWGGTMTVRSRFMAKFAAEEAAWWECCPSTTATKLLTPVATTEHCSSEINFRFIFFHLLQIQSSVWKQTIAKTQFTCLKPGLGISCIWSTLFSVLWSCALLLSRLTQG